MAHLPIYKVLWAPTNQAHYNHLHVEGNPPIRGKGLGSDCTSAWSSAVTEIWQALDAEFGSWSTMGVYNCRNIAGTNTPSQHAYSNAIDIGPYYGVAQQQKFYDFLMKEESMAVLTDAEQRELQNWLERLEDMQSNVSYISSLIPDIRKNIITKDELDAAIAAAGGTAKDQVARNVADSALSLARQIRNKLRDLY